VIGEEDVQQGKPSPEVFLKAAQGLQLPPENCLVFEDSHSGVEAAQRAGMKVVFINTSLRPQDENTTSSVLFTTDSYLNLNPEKFIASELT
jgi:beta-phosphoglucomutase-like phosphatase (HAD superfamily)